MFLPPDTELVGIALTLKPDRDFTLPPQYTTQFHGWFLHQIRTIDPQLSQQLHDGQGEKAFTISQLQGAIVADKEIRLSRDRTYTWHITALSRALCDVLRQWLARMPAQLTLRTGSYQILFVTTCYPPTTYSEIWQRSAIDPAPLELTFITPTSFRKRSNHLPLPVPENLFNSYLRRWNHFAAQQFNSAEFLDWVNDRVVIYRHEIHSVKVQAGKSGSVTGFVGKVQLGIAKGAHQPEYARLVRALIRCAPYFNTGHKVTFGLGQTRLGWGVEGLDLGQPAARENDDRDRPDRIQAREQELAPIFLSLRKRQGGDRAMKTASIWAQIIARLEAGVSLNEIAIELQMPYDTVKKYAQLAKKQLSQQHKG